MYQVMKKSVLFLSVLSIATFTLADGYDVSASSNQEVRLGKSIKDDRIGISFRYYEARSTQTATGSNQTYETRIKSKTSEIGIFYRKYLKAVESLKPFCELSYAYSYGKERREGDFLETPVEESQNGSRFVLSAGYEFMISKNASIDAKVGAQYTKYSRDTSDDSSFYIPKGEVSVHYYW